MGRRSRQESLPRSPPRWQQDDEHGRGDRDLSTGRTGGQLEPRKAMFVVVDLKKSGNEQAIEVAKVLAL